jgi:coenzyme PQQ precursor peptide PqqA
MTEQHVPVPEDPPAEPGVRWRTPGYDVIETSLEVTMYLSPKL